MKSPRPWFGLSLGMLLLVATCGGCGHDRGRIMRARTAYVAGDLDGSRRLLEEHADSRRPDADVARLDLALVLLAQGQPQQAEETLRAMRDRLDLAASADLTEEAVRLLTDEQQTAFSGEPHERVLVRTFLALANLLHDGGDALAYSLQSEAEVRRWLPSAPGENVPPGTAVALSPYLHAVLREEQHVDPQPVTRHLARAGEWEPRFSPASLELSRAASRGHSASGHGVVYVFALVGRGPYREARTEVPSTVALAIADELIKNQHGETLPTVPVPVEIPVVVPGSSVVDHLHVANADGASATTAVVTDVTRLAIERDEERRPYRIARVVARRAVKKAVVAAGRDAAVSQAGTWAGLASEVGGLVWEAAEQPDLRCWTMLPDTIQVARIELPTGTHTLHITPRARGRATSPGTPTEVPVRDGRNTYLLVVCPEDRVIGTPLVR